MTAADPGGAAPGGAASGGAAPGQGDYFANHARARRFPWTLYHKPLEADLARFLRQVSAEHPAGEILVVGCGLPEGATGHNIARNKAGECFTVRADGFWIAAQGLELFGRCQQQFFDNEPRDVVDARPDVRRQRRQLEVESRQLGAADRLESLP